VAEYRKILHIDMDAFFASVEQRDYPELRGKPVVVGGRPETRGAVAAASYDARKFGIHSAMPSRVAATKCKDLIFVPGRFEVYRQVSQQLHEVFLAVTDLVEPVSLDEAYLDVTDNKSGEPSAIAIAKQIKRQILEATQLTASAGVSYNKFLAKMASGINKPDGLSLIHPRDAQAFIAQLPIEKFHGIGPATARRMHDLGIQSGADLRERTEQEKVGHHYYSISRGIDERPVNPNRIRKSLGAEKSFYPDLSDREELFERLRAICNEVEHRLSEHGKSGHTVTLKLKYADYELITRSRTQQRYLKTSNELFVIAAELLHHNLDPDKEVRLLGVTVSGFAEAEESALPHQLRLPF
jgi:DNA polymerase-4